MEHQLRMTFSLICKGLVVKADLLKKEPNRYPCSPCLQHGINQFLAASMELGHVGDRVWDDADEASFLGKYLERPVAQWFSDWESQSLAALHLEEEPFFRLGPLALWEDENRFIPSEDCLDYLDAQDADLCNGTDERILYEKIRVLSQEHYTLLRRFIIEHPLASAASLRAIRQKLIGSSGALDALDFAYETWEGDAFRCPACGWTMTQGRHGLECHSRHCLDPIPILTEKDRIRCEDGRVLRLKKGVMRYIAQPGKLEVKIEEFCQKQGLPCTLWPMMDTFDAEICFPDGQVWEIDAKAYRNPILLRSKIQGDPAFSGGGFDRGFYVVPTEYTRGQENYTSIVNRGLTSGVECITWNQLRQRIKRKAVQLHAEK